MAANRAASRAIPFLLRSNPRAARLRYSALTRDIKPVAIVFPYRGLQTETSSSTGSSSNFPPPGFNAEQAKKPFQKDEQAQGEQSAKSKDGSVQAAISKEDVKIPQAQPTADPKTKANEAHTLTEIAAEKSKEASGKTAVAKKDEEKKKLTLWQKIKHEAVHYWDGTKLLATEVKISSKLALRMAAGYELTRREHRQLQRTVQDLGRLVPFSVFVIVPFAELLLPVALRLFPNLLPSTYEGKDAKDKKATSLRSTRKETSNFLRQTLRETGLPVSVKDMHKQEFTDFFKKVRASGESPTKQDVIKVCKLFKDDLTLDNLSRPQLVGICRYMNLNPIGPDTLLRYQIRHRMRQIKRDDRAISYETVESLSVPELQTACASRGLRTHGMSPGRLRDDLQMWLDLRLKYGVPSTLLVLSNAFMYSQGKETEFDSQIDALQSVLSSIPEELFHEIELEVHTAEGAATNKQRLEVLKEQEELIQEEREQQQETAQSGRETPKDTDNIDEDTEEHKGAAEIQASEAAEAEQQRALLDKQEAEAGSPPAEETKTKETK